MHGAYPFVTELSRLCKPYVGGGLLRFSIGQLKSFWLKSDILVTFR